MNKLDQRVRDLKAGKPTIRRPCTGIPVPAIGVAMKCQKPCDQCAAYQAEIDAAKAKLPPTLQPPEPDPEENPW